MNIFRQGDVLIRKIRKAPKGERKAITDGILAHGEVTGHAHRVADLEQAELYNCGDGMYLSVGEGGVSIVHDEHAPIVLPAGEFQVIRQMEYAPAEIRNVAD